MQDISPPLKVDTITGMVACSGYAKGRVRVVSETAGDHKFFKKGEILVTNLLSPDHAIIVHKAKAVIADIGALMSHSAIIIRELRIPCIVGVKIATQILKDGDMVEVDARIGTVKIIYESRKIIRAPFP